MRCVSRCDDQGRLYAMAMLYNNQSGTLPSAVARLTDLQVMLIGPPISMEALFVWSVTSESTLRVSSLSGSLPAAMSQLSQLRVLNLLDCTQLAAKVGIHTVRGISGTLPQVNTLEHLFLLWHGALSGSIPHRSSRLISVVAETMAPLLSGTKNGISAWCSFCWQGRSQRGCRR